MAIYINTNLLASRKKRHIKETTEHLNLERGEDISMKLKFASG